MNSTKLLISVAVVCLVSLSAQAQSILEDLILESATASSILQLQVGSDISITGTSLGSNAFDDGNNAAFMQAFIGPDPGQTGQLEFASEFNNNGSSWTEFDDVSFPNAAAIPEPSSLLLFGVGGLAVAFYKKA
jgi:hypothetical protein